MKNYKTGLTVFLILATIISLFPPFEWGDENIKTERERIKNRNILESLPIKEYDFLFASNKKYFITGSNQIYKKLYEGEELEVDTSDIISMKIEKGFDEFTIKRNNPNLMESIITTSIFHKDKLEIKTAYVSDEWALETYNDITNRTGNHSTKQYFKIFTIVKPNYYLLSREIIPSELVIEYLLAGFISFFVQIIITFTKRKRLSEKSNS